MKVNQAKIPKEKGKRWTGRSDVWICLECKQQHLVKKKSKRIKYCIMCGGELVREDQYALDMPSNKVFKRVLTAIDAVKKDEGDRPVDNTRERRGLNGLA